MVLNRPAMLVALLLHEVSLIWGDDEAPDIDYKAVCERFDTYYRRRFPEAKRSPCSVLYDHPSFAEQFKEYMEANGKTYKSDSEERMRFANFAANLVFMLEMGKKNAAFTMAVNAFADMTPEEFHQTHLGLNDTSVPTLGASPPTGQHVPPSLDWVALGAVRAPVNQGGCNSCWAFAATGALEGAWFARTGQLVDLSEQQFLDCTNPKLGCDSGGKVVPAFKRVAMSQPLCTDETYPYTGEQGTCRQSTCTTVIPRGAVTGFEDVQPNSEQALKEALFNAGPVAVGIDAMGNEVMFYKSGVLTAPCSDRQNHAVLVVGFGVQDPHPYWKVKNSWGKRWGEDGFFRLVRGREGSGECGIKTRPIVPIVAAARFATPAGAALAPPASLGGSSHVHGTPVFLPLVVLVGAVAGGCVFMVLCSCCAHEVKTWDAEMVPLYSPVFAAGDSESSDDDDAFALKRPRDHLRH